MSAAQSTTDTSTLVAEVKLFNTMTRAIEPFRALIDREARVYCCGPTVYNFQHIGNLRTYLFEDILARTLRKAGYAVTHVMNVTDVGHLASDADEGEDKMLLAQKREGKKSHEIAEYYTKVFFDDCKQLNILKPDIVCKATDHIPQMIALIERLIERGYAYQSSGNVYFDVSRYDEYGTLSGQSLDSLKAGARIDVDTSKRNPLDFALWFTKSKFENQELQWDSPWGRGYPGWHIECSAMSMEYLGESFDIHCGGIDHIPVHHTNEIAQSECATGKTFASIWMHGGFLVESGGKMSKSKGEFLTLSTLKEKGFEPLAYRYLCLTSHYRNELSWSWKSLEGAQNSLDRLRSRILEIQDIKVSTDSDSSISDNSISPKAESFRIAFYHSLYTDLNMPQCLASVYELLSDKEITNAEKSIVIRDFDVLLGLDLHTKKKQDTSELPIPEEIRKLCEERDQARARKDFKKSDELRDTITAAGYSIKDTPSGGVLVKK
jgi:cysteinyl-tRNA synthetase